jgi:hypothetical protein
MSALLAKQTGLLLGLFKFGRGKCHCSSSLESYFGNCEGVDTVTLCIPGNNSKEACFIVPKYVLTQASKVFQRMFANEMTEKSSGKVVIEDTNVAEFGDFLKAISPKQELPNRKFYEQLLYQTKSTSQHPMCSLCSNWPTVTIVSCCATVVNFI